MVRVLCTGDIHIGRPISGIPIDAAIGQIKTASAWEAIVDLALRECPDLVAISGDLIDEKNKYFEAVGPVERGLTALRDAGISVVAVAGNHDWEVLPVIARANPDLIHLVGLNQRWERKTIEREGQPLIHVDGWSFSSRHTAVDPLDSYRAVHPGTAPVLGLVHVDLDATDRKYAPTSRWKLQQQPVDAWLIGHIHVPSLIENAPSPSILYPGSPYAIDPGETGMHGAWMLHFDGGQPPHFHFHQLSPVQFGAIQIDITGGTYEADVLEHIERTVREYLDAAEKATRLELLLLRATLVGVLPAGLSLADIIQRIPERRFGTGSVAAFITRIEQRTTLDLNIELMAASTNVTGTLAAVIQSRGADLVAAAKVEIEALKRKRDFSAMADELEMSDEELTEFFEAEAWRLMNALMAQRHAVNS